VSGTSACEVLGVVLVEGTWKVLVLEGTWKVLVLIKFWCCVRVVRLVEGMWVVGRVRMGLVDIV
jgi:hypothetical protein